MMKLNNNVFVLLFCIFFSATPLSADNLELKLQMFNLEIDGKTACVELVDFEKLEPIDEQDFVESTNDFDAVRQMFGVGIAWAFWGVSWFNSAAAYQAMLEKNRQLKETNPNFVNYTWFIREKDTKKFVGHITLKTPHAYPSEGQVIFHGIDKKNLLEIGLAITANFRKKRYVSRLAKTFLQKLKDSTTLKDKVILAFARQDNGSLNHIANKVGFTLIETTQENFDFVLFKSTLDLNVYTLNLAEWNSRVSEDSA